MRTRMTALLLAVGLVLASGSCGLFGRGEDESYPTPASGPTAEETCQTLVDSGALHEEQYTTCVDTVRGRSFAQNGEARIAAPGNRLAVTNNTATVGVDIERNVFYMSHRFKLGDMPDHRFAGNGGDAGESWVDEFPGCSWHNAALDRDELDIECAVDDGYLVPGTTTCQTTKAGPERVGPDKRGNWRVNSDINDAQVYYGTHGERNAALYVDKRTHRGYVTNQFLKKDRDGKPKRRC